MTRYQYLQMRNRRRLPLQDMPPSVIHLFLDNRENGTAYQIRRTTWPEHWSWIPVNYCDMVYSIVWRIHKQHRPAGLTDEDDPD